MVELSLNESAWNNKGDDQSGVEDRVSLLNKLESVIWSLLLSSGGRSEARLWLCKTISGINSITPRCQRELFVNLLRSKPSKRGFAAQLLHMIFEKNPKRAGPVAAKKSYRLDSFFEGNPRRILDWFSNFSCSGDVNHRKGARALSQFSFVNRDICWEELEWNGKHGQSPAMVATNPHYFLDLDVHRTVQNFIEYVPEFWSSDEFADSIKDGDIFSLDTDYFVRMFVDLMYEDDLKEVWDMINDFLVEECFSSLCSRLLLVLEEKELQIFLDLIRKYLNPKMDGDFTNPSFWIEIVLSECEGCDSLDQLLLVNAFISQGRQLLKVLKEEGADEKTTIKHIVSEIHNPSYYSSMFSYVMQNCFKTRTLESVKLLGLNSWALHYVLSEEDRSPESWESLFVSNGIGFRKYNEYGLLGNDHICEESESDFGERDSIRGKRKKKKKEKYRKKGKIRNLDHDHDDDYDDELLHFDSSNNKLNLKSNTCSWLLSTDGYTTSWSSVDLPEHLSRHCFSTWMKYVCAKWIDKV